MADQSGGGGFSFDLAARRMGWLDARGRVLAANIANADTPRFAARDVVPFAQMLGRAVAPVAMARTSPRDLPVPGEPTGVALAAIGPHAIDGNDVVLDSQLEQVADVDQQAQLADGLTTTYLGLFRTALGR